jgi:hypothetical protein
MRRQWLVCAFLGAILLALGHIGSAEAGPKPQDGTAKAASAQVPLASDYVGSETCATCHAEISDKFGNNPASARSADSSWPHCRRD